MRSINPPITIVAEQSLLYYSTPEIAVITAQSLKSNKKMQRAYGASRRLGTLHAVCSKLSPRVRRDDMPPPPPWHAVRLAADLRPSADGSAVRTSQVAGQLQAAGMPIA